MTVENFYPEGDLVRIVELARDSSTDHRFSGACLQDPSRVTQSQQAVEYAGLSHSVQLEMSKSLRCTLMISESLLHRLGDALRNAWFFCRSRLKEEEDLNC